MARRGHKIKLILNNKQATQIKTICGCNRLAYNWCLAESIRLYKENSSHKFNKFEIKKSFNSIKYDKFPFLKGVSSHAVVNSAVNKLSDAYSRFFKGLGRFPKFKRKKDGRDSFSLAFAGDGVKYDRNKRVYLPTVGWCKLTEKLRFDCVKIYNVTISIKYGIYYISFSCEVNDNRVCENQAEKIGIDLGVKDIAVCSDGLVVQNHRIKKEFIDRERRLNKELSRRTIGNKNWKKTVLKLQRLHRTIKAIRSDYTHKFTTDITRKYGMVCIEDLNVSKMMHNHSLAKAISDCNFFEIRRQFEYKARQILYVDRFFPSSKQCSRCGCINNNLRLSDREWVCSACGEMHNRDLNAALNIRDNAKYLVK